MHFNDLFYEIYYLCFMPGKVLVHCMMGISRSATCALAYLMINRKMSAVDAIRTMRMRRDVRPNDGFLQQLADLDNELRRERQYTYWSYSLFVKIQFMCVYFLNLLKTLYTKTLLPKFFFYILLLFVCCLLPKKITK